MRRTFFLFGLVVFFSGRSLAGADDDLPEVIPVGSGSYASRPPRNQAARPGVQGKAGWGDLSQVFTHMKLWVRDDYKGAVPSTDWWTSLVTRQWSGQLWSYPSMVKAESQGVAVYFPKKWKLSGNKKKMGLESASRLLVRGKGFVPEAAVAEDWSDWLVVFRMDQSPEAGMKVTIGHGLPCTWFETRGMDLRIDAEKPAFFIPEGPDTRLPFAGHAIGIESMGDCYGIFAPDGTRFEMDGSSLAIRFSGIQKWISVAVLPSRKDLAVFQKLAAVVPRKTTVTWNYSEEKGELETKWVLDTENLSGGPERDVIQGWIPHHYDTAKGTRLDFSFNGLDYATPRGKLKCATGRSFNITYPFRGLLPELPAPRIVPGLEHPYRPELMKQIIDGYTSVTGYGFETYWGGKKILLFAKYMEMAHQLGMDEQAAVFRSRLSEALTDWATYEPGEPDHFFAMYPNWGSLVGFRTRDNQNPGIDVLQDHAFCYGYHVYAASLLAIHDKDFARNYGGMATLMVKDYANWEREDSRFPFFRSMDPWCGHSWSGGTGSEEGNGQESSSEAVQAWGAMFVLGDVLENRGMRDAALFGYVSETRAIAEYWFDRDKENIPRDIWPHAYNSNLETNGIGWWTWFSGNEFWMHAIQWLPMSPFLKFLEEDQEFARWDYETMWKNKNGNGWEGDLGTDSGVGNITLSYLQLFDPGEAARIFDDLWDRNKGAVHAKEEPGPTYYRIHAGRALGSIRWDAWSDIPTSTVYRANDGKTTVAVYNTRDTARQGRLFEQGKQTATFTVPARTLATYSVDAAGVASLVSSSAGSWDSKAALNSSLPVSANLALGKKAKASSMQGEDVDAAKAFDGALESRWSSAGKKEDEWVLVDLGSFCEIERVVLRWEAAYGKDYDIQLSNDGQNWSTFSEKRGGQGGVDELKSKGTGRYVRMQGVKRGSGFGWSLFEFEIYGRALVNDDKTPRLSKITVEPKAALMSDKQTQQFTAKGYDQFGKEMPLKPSWSVRGKGSIDQQGLYTPTGGTDHETSRFGIIAEAEGVEGLAWAAVEESRRVAKINLKPAGASIVMAEGSRLQWEAGVMDQFNARYVLPLSWKVEGNLKVSQDGEVTAGSAGQGTLSVEAGAEKVRVAIKVVSAEQVNIAALKPVTASSVEKGGTEAELAVDGDSNTRWSSSSSDPQWIQVDLEKAYSLKKVSLLWQNAAAKVYQLEVSMDGSEWKAVQEIKDGKAGLRVFELNGVPARYLKVSGSQRTTGYGYSIFEIEVFGSAIP